MVVAAGAILCDDGVGGGAPCRPGPCTSPAPAVVAIEGRPGMASAKESKLAPLFRCFFTCPIDPYHDLLCLLPPVRTRMDASYRHDDRSILSRFLLSPIP
jgi:hypothetical protein